MQAQMNENKRKADEKKDEFLIAVGAFEKAFDEYIEAGGKIEVEPYCDVCSGIGWRGGMYYDEEPCPACNPKPC